MAKVTVKQLAETVKVPVDRLLKQMQEAGLSHGADDDVVSEEEKQQLLAHLQKFRGDSQDSKKKITLRRKSTGTIKQGQGRTGRDVTVEVRKKRTYIKKEDPPIESLKDYVFADSTENFSTHEAHIFRAVFEPKSE